MQTSLSTAHRTVTPPNASVPRRIVHRTTGRQHGPIRRMMSPGELGQVLKPFVFLDHVRVQAENAPRFGLHPHSGIATLTFTLEGEGFYEETTGHKGVLATGDVEWMVAGGGVWHNGGASGSGLVEAFQLWIALPPGLENGASRSQHIVAADIPRVGPARVLLGDYAAARSPADAPSGVTYLAVDLKDGEPWTFEPPAGHEVAWLMVHRGVLETDATIAAGELVVFDESTEAIRFTARGPTGFVFGSAVRHPHELVLGYYSVHTSAAALATGEAGIATLAAELQRQGKL